jgi:hypothetical protein
MLLHPASSSFDMLDDLPQDEDSSPLFDSVRDLDESFDQSWDEHDRPTFVP